MFAQLSLAEPAPPGQLKGSERGLGGLQPASAEPRCLLHQRNPGTSRVLSRAGGAQPGLVVFPNLLVPTQPLAPLGAGEEEEEAA